MPIHNSALRKFLAINRFRELFKAFSRYSHQQRFPQVHSVSLFIALFIGCGPLLLGSLQSPLSPQFLTALVGVSACLSIFFRRYLNLEMNLKGPWIESLRLTHTAFALGCVPAVIILIFHPAALFQVTETIIPGGAGAKVQIDKFTLICEILIISLWAGVTEELIFRGMLLSAIRRWKHFSSPWTANLVAIFLSSTIFALGHLPVWGPGLSFAVFGIGIGLGVAYIANDERILPLIIYHSLFDFLSIGFSLLTFK